MEHLFNIFDQFVHADWFNTALGAVAILLVTLVISRVTVSFMRRLLDRTTLLPSSSIFINLVRVVVWIVGVGCVLSICFDVNVNAMVTGLGVVGIAISLGFQDTLSNLLGGLQVSLSRSVEPGDNIRMGPSGVSGVVQDVTWRYTSIVDSAGNRVNIPNSLMTSTAVAKLAPLNEVSIALIVTTDSERLTAAAHHIEAAAEKAVSRVSRIKKGPSVSFSAITEHGFKGSLNFTIADADRASHATDAAIRAIAPYVHNHLIEEAVDTLAGKAVGKPADAPVVSEPAEVAVAAAVPVPSEGAEK
ncbi:mechanosensitive ion channel family protein [Adlercreutzia mucosicola]|uniref:mechanosensitive ion channel family protein n=1 Tax=Adlercreutzia mucosicola TaxID=580026 RepID=UPI002B254EAF|nr:mechanosensitive ion channel family protein [Adlercreutzia mucosicola]MEB1813099.1 mechanosensitive ion channel family protein [Adlercreutzia mucosicola]